VPGLKRLYNIIRYGVGPRARERKRSVKDAARRRRFASERWEKGAGLAQRRYEDYDEYLMHQASKLTRIQHRLDETEAEDQAEFRRRFETCPHLRPRRSILCLGARIGTEVRALHELGHFAVGIDLNPGEGNRYVLPGDFHAIQFPDGCVDVVYTNCLDHVFDLGRLLGECHRLLGPEGCFITDVLPGFEEGWTPGEYEASHWKSVDALIAEIENRSPFRLADRRALGAHRRDSWFQLVFHPLPPE